MSKCNLLAIAIAASACCIVTSASAEDRDPLAARVTLDVGGFFLSTDTRVRADGETTGRVGTDLDYDDTFGLGDFDRFRVDAMWRIAPRHAIRAMYFENNRGGTRNIDRDIHFGDATFPVGESVTARSELAVAQLSYDYAFLRRERYEVAGSIGMHMLDLGLSLNATLSGPGGSVSAVGESATTTARYRSSGCALPGACHTTSMSRRSCSTSRSISIRTTAVSPTSRQRSSGRQQIT